MGSLGAWAAASASSVWLPRSLRPAFARHGPAPQLTLEVTQAREHVVGAVVAPPPVLLQATQAEPIELRRCLSVELGRWDRVVCAHSLQQVSRGGGGKRRLTGQ